MKPRDPVTEPQSDQEECEFRDLFTDMPHGDLVEAACRLSEDAARLRRQLDAVLGVVR